MVRISTHIDIPRRLPGTREIIRSMLALSAVGTSEHGTLNLAKGIGTVSSLDVGSLFMSYGSSGTTAGRISRHGYGSAGTHAGGILRHRYGSFTGTVGAPRAVFQRGSFLRIAGSLGATRITHGTLGAARHQLLQNIPGSLNLETKASGSLQQTQLPRSITQRGTLAGSIGSFRRFTVRGTVRGRVGSFGSVIAPRILSPIGSFARIAGSLGATRITHGTLAVSRLPRPQGPASINLRGTLFRPPARPRFVWMGIELRPTALLASEALILARGPVGTLARVGAPAAADNRREQIFAWVSPASGSYLGSFLGTRPLDVRRQGLDF